MVSVESPVFLMERDCAVCLVSGWHEAVRTVQPCWLPCCCPLRDRGCHVILYLEHTEASGVISVLVPFMVCFYGSFKMSFHIDFMTWPVYNGRAWELECSSLRSEVICEKSVRPSSIRVTLGERGHKYLRFELKFV